MICVLLAILFAGESKWIEVEPNVFLRSYVGDWDSSRGNVETLILNPVVIEKRALRLPTPDDVDAAIDVSSLLKRLNCLSDGDLALSDWKVEGYDWKCFLVEQSFHGKRVYQGRAPTVVCFNPSDLSEPVFCDGLLFQLHDEKKGNLGQSVTQIQAAVLLARELREILIGESVGDMVFKEKDPLFIEFDLVWASIRNPSKYTLYWQLNGSDDDPGDGDCHWLVSLIDGSVVCF